MTSAKQSKNVRSAAKSNASRDVTEIPGIAARCAAACDLLRVPRGRVAIVVACSGGADSAAALHMMRLARPRARLFACYVDHGVRPKSSIARDRRAVRAQAQAAQAKAEFVRLRAVSHKGVSPEAALRAARYRALASFAQSVGARWVVTGHQRDDVAESTLMALARGSGIDGLAAMRPRRAIADGVEIVRPLLWASKKSLAKYADAAGLDVSVDETNADLRYRRNAIRTLLRALDSSVGGSIRAIARSAALAVEDKALLDAVTLSAWKRCSAGDGRGLIASDLRKLPMALLRRVLRFEVKRVSGSSRDFTYEHCAAIAGALKEHRGGTYHAGAVCVTLSGGRATVDAKQSAAIDAEPVEFDVPKSSAHIEWNGGRIDVRVRRKGSRRKSAGTGSLELDGTSLAPGTPLTVRLPAQGDRFVPSGRHSDVSLSRFLAKTGLSRTERTSVPLLCRNGRIVAVLGVRPAAEYIAHPAGRVLEVAWQPPNPPSLDYRADE